MTRFICLLLFVISITTSFAQKVANYSFGKPGTPEYEEFSFWIKDNKRDNIDYTYGKDWKDVNVSYSGIDKVNGAVCFKVKFSNNYVLYITPKGKKLTVTDNAGKYNKVFSWAYEGPVEGIGTFCEPCAEDEDEAMALVKGYFLK